jgi:hypothetical protein
MSKKRLKKKMRLYVEAGRGPLPNDIFPTTSDRRHTELEEVMMNCGEASFTVYKVNNGFNVACHFKVVDSTGNIKGHKHNITYVRTLEELPTMLTAAYAAFKVSAP